ncbi:MAG TPA: glycosyl hydrolase [Clostridiales bacterium]|nr:glycosyl hydrolase [Clostridiales bacterium]
MGISRKHRLNFTKQAKEILQGLTLEEKISLMGGNMTVDDMYQEFIADPDNHHYNMTPIPAGGIEGKGIPPVLFCDGPRGAACGAGQSTCFPVTMLRGATFDRKLERRIGQAIGREIRAYRGNLSGGVCINLPYHPGWGRSQETYGEESYHIGEMGSQLVKGLQREGVIACLKHYAFNQMEYSRFKVNIECDKRTEREVFLPHFKKCIEAGAACVMTAYNKYQGVDCSHHDYLINRVLKEEWGFDGFVISDFAFGVKDTVEAALGGMNIEMCFEQYFGRRLLHAVEAGAVPVEIIDDAALRIIRTLLAFEKAAGAKRHQYYHKENTEDLFLPMHSGRCLEEMIGSPSHRKLALQAAREGITLIKNDGILPLDKKETTRLVVLGRLGNAENTGDRGSSNVWPPYVVTPLRGIKKVAPDIEVVFYPGMNLEHSKRIASQADAVIFTVGYDYLDEGEFTDNEELGIAGLSTGGDRAVELGLHREEVRLIKEVSRVNPNSVVVLFGGNMIMLEEWKEEVGAILMAYYPGMEGGTALGEILFGKVNPSGKLPFVIPKREEDLPEVNWHTEYQWYDYYHGYAKLEKEGKEPDLPFGFGLSYTRFQISDGDFSADKKGITASCTVKNTGGRAGDEVLQLYVGFKNSRIDRPHKLLRGFERITLAPGESIRMSLLCPWEEIKWYNPSTGQFELEHMEYEVYIGTSSARKDLLEGRIKIENAGLG